MSMRTEADIRLILTHQLNNSSENPLLPFGEGAREALLWVLGEKSRVALGDPDEIRKRVADYAAHLS